MKEIYGIDITIWIEDAVEGATTGSEYPVGEDTISISLGMGYPMMRWYPSTAQSA